MESALPFSLCFMRGAALNAYPMNHYILANLYHILKAQSPFVGHLYIFLYVKLLLFTAVL